MTFFDLHDTTAQCTLRHNFIHSIKVPMLFTTLIASQIRQCVGSGRHLFVIPTSLKYNAKQTYNVIILFKIQVYCSVLVINVVIMHASTAWNHNNF